RSADAAARSLQVLDEPAVRAAWADAGVRIAVAASGVSAFESSVSGDRSSSVSGDRSSSPEASSSGASSSGASSGVTSSGSSSQLSGGEIPAALLGLVDEHVQSLAGGLPAGAPARGLVTGIAQTMAVNRVWQDLRSGRLQDRLSGPLDARDAAAVGAAAQVLSTALFEHLVAQGRERVRDPFLPDVAAPAQEQRAAALSEAFDALNGLDVLAARVAASGLAPQRASSLMNGLWVSFLGSVPRVLAGAPAQTIAAAQRQLAAYGRAGVSESQRLPLWHQRALDLADPQSRPEAVAETRVFVQEAARLLWRWAADPSAPVPRQTPAARAQAAAVAAAQSPGAQGSAADRNAWVRGGVVADPGPRTALPLALVVPYVGVNVPVPSSIADWLGTSVGLLLDGLPRDTGGAFEAYVATAGLMYENLPRLSDLQQRQVVPLTTALTGALYESLLGFGREPDTWARAQVVREMVQWESAQAAAQASAAVPAQGASQEAARALPESVRAVFAGLAPAVNRLAVGGWGVDTILRLLPAVREVVINGALAQTLAGAPPATVESARQDLVRFWEAAGSRTVAGAATSTATGWAQLLAALREPLLAQARAMRALSQAEARARQEAQAQGQGQAETQAPPAGSAAAEVRELTMALSRVRAAAPGQLQAASDALLRAAVNLENRLADWVSGGPREVTDAVTESGAVVESGAAAERPVSAAVADGLLGLGQQRLDAKDSRESTVSRAQDRPSLLVLTEGLADAARQVAVSWPGVPAQESGVPAELLAGAQSGPEVAQRLREAAQQLALAQVRELAAGEATRSALSSLVNDPAGPFGEATWAGLAQRLDGPAGQSPAVRAAAVEETLAGVSRQFQAAVARWVPGYEWFRR
ncbi:MAG TPA: hypothetical protein VFP72_05400, partial [Kineosporiaceae bacterium]|nr:hypothetical protein [Kineosporiaceae bacterium]